MFRLETKERVDLWNQITQAIEDYFAAVDDLPIDSRAQPSDVRSFLSAVNFQTPLPASDATKFVVDGMRKFHVHNSNPGYFGLFVPPATTMGIAGDMLASAFNLVLGGWALSPFGVELERKLVLDLAVKFGYTPQEADGLFAAGGTEANHTALLCALTALSPQIKEHGLAAFGRQPLVYASKEAHHSVHKVAMLCGLGRDAVRDMEVDAKFQMDPDRLDEGIKKDKADGKCPCMIVATAGTTNAGATDPLLRIGEVARTHSLWFHADAAWGGAAILAPELRYLLEGIAAADSITIDAHKWLSVPMTAGIFLTRHSDVLQKTFSVAGPYMPPLTQGAAIDPFRHSMQWSRPCRGLKLFLSLAVAGWEGYEHMIRERVRMEDRMRGKLWKNGWKVVNDTALPLVCFQDATVAGGNSPEFLDEIVRRALDSGRVWISRAALPGRVPAIRACITNFLTREEHIDEFIEVLDRAKSSVLGQGVYA
jgi:glutamate/tyrosine decarboxylase-like PLP-dependent enzyme